MTVADHEEPRAPGRDGRQMARSIHNLPAPLLASFRPGTPPRVKGGLEAVAKRCERERALLTRGGVAEDPRCRAGRVYGSATSSLSGFCTRACFPRIASATCANDVPLETATNRWAPMACGPNVDQPGARAGGSVPSGRGRLRRPVLRDKGSIGRPGTARPSKLHPRPSNSQGRSDRITSPGGSGLTVRHRYPAYVPIPGAIQLASMPRVECPRTDTSYQLSGDR
jgi:hypothetical protein